MNLDFEHNGKKYKVEFAPPPSGSLDTSVGCHSRVVSGIGAVQIRHMWEMDDAGSVRRELTTDYDPWGQATLPKKILAERYSKEPEVFKDIIYRLVAGRYLTSGVVIFSDHVNGGTPLKGALETLAQNKLGGAVFSPASFAKWLHQHRDEFGPVYATPVFGNPMHRDTSSWSLVQVFTWIPKPNAWSIAPELSEIPCVADPEYTKEKMLEATLPYFPRHNKKSLESILQVTYK